MYSNDKGLPLSLAVMLAHDEYPEHREGVISVTSLIKPVKQLILSRRIAKKDSGSSKDISGQVASTYGTAMHNALEHAWKHKNLPKTLQLLGYPKSVALRVLVNPEPDDILEDSIPIYTEQRTEKEFMGWTISGESDFIAEGRVRDLKTTGVYSYTSGCNDSKYILQGSMYRWLKPDIITDDLMAIDYIFTDWSGLQASIQKDKYPALRMTEKLFPLMSLSETEAYIEEKLDYMAQYADADESLIPNCTNEDLWVGPSKWKYFKNPEKTLRATRNYDSQSDALAHHTKDGGVGLVVEKKDTIKACRYCDALPICQQAQRYLDSGELKL